MSRFSSNPKSCSKGYRGTLTLVRLCQNPGDGRDFPEVFDRILCECLNYGVDPNFTVDPTLEAFLTPLYPGQDSYNGMQLYRWNPLGLILSCLQPSPLKTRITDRLIQVGAVADFELCLIWSDKGGCWVRPLEEDVSMFRRTLLDRSSTARLRFRQGLHDRPLIVSIGKSSGLTFFFRGVLDPSFNHISEFKMEIEGLKDAADALNWPQKYDSALEVEADKTKDMFTIKFASRFEYDHYFRSMPVWQHDRLLILIAMRPE